MNATKSDSVANTSSPDEAAAGRMERRRTGSGKRAVKPAPERSESAEVDFERHDTIPAPTWLDDGSETS